MKTIHISIFLIIFICLSSCKANSDKVSEVNADGVETIYIKPQEAEKIKLSSIAEDIKYWIPDDNKMVGVITRMEFINDKFYIYDKVTKLLSVFDSNGNFIHDIGYLGNGPGEYTNIHDFTVSPDNNSIYILDRNSRKIISYDSGGNFLKNIPLTVMGKELCYRDGSLWVFTAGSDHYTKQKDKDYNLFKLNGEGDILQSYMKYNPLLDNNVNYKTFHKGVDNLCFHYGINNNIYQVDSTLNLATVVDFGECNIPYGQIDENNSLQYLNNPQYARVECAASSDDVMYISYSYNNRFYGWIKYKNNSSVNYSLIENDIDRVSLDMSVPHLLIGNKVYFIKNIDEVFYNTEDDFVALPSVCGGTATITRDSNPVIAVLTLKEN